MLLDSRKLKQSAGVISKDFNCSHWTVFSFSPCVWDGHKNLSPGWWVFASLLVTCKGAYNFISKLFKKKEVLKSAYWKAFMSWAWLVIFSWLWGSRHVKLSLVDASLWNMCLAGLSMCGTAFSQTLSMSYWCEKPWWKCWWKPACNWSKSLYNCISHISFSLRYSGVFRGRQKSC